MAACCVGGRTRQAGRGRGRWSCSSLATYIHGALEGACASRMPGECAASYCMPMCPYMSMSIHAHPCGRRRHVHICQLPRVSMLGSCFACRPMYMLMQCAHGSHRAANLPSARPPTRLCPRPLLQSKRHHQVLVHMVCCLQPANQTAPPSVLVYIAYCLQPNGTTKC